MELDYQVGLVKPAIQVRDAVSRNLDPRGKRALLMADVAAPHSSTWAATSWEYTPFTARHRRREGATPRLSCGNAGQSRGFAGLFLAGPATTERLGDNPPNGLGP